MVLTLGTDSTSTGEEVLREGTGDLPEGGVFLDGDELFLLGGPDDLVGGPAREGGEPEGGTFALLLATEALPKLSDNEELFIGTKSSSSSSSYHSSSSS